MTQSAPTGRFTKGSDDLRLANAFAGLAADGVTANPDRIIEFYVMNLWRGSSR
jgi:hypothetical protein